MRKHSVRMLSLLCALAMLLCLLPAASAAEVGEFTVLSTTDMHGRCWDTNLLTDGSVSNSMLNVSTAVAKIRGSSSNVLLIDNGDTYQGTPVSTYQLSQQKQGLTELPNPMALSMKYIGYDASILGNHEFNYDWKTMTEVRDYLAGDEMTSVPTVCANLYCEDGTNVCTPYIFKNYTIGGKEFTIAIIGFENTDCPRWDVSDNYPGMVFTHPDNTYGAMSWEAERYVSEVREKGADFVIVAYHAGLGSGADGKDLVFGQNTEGQVLAMIQNTEGIDMVIAGHDHSASYSGSTYKNKKGEDVLVVNGGGVNLTSSTFSVDADGNVTLKKTENLPLSNYLSDAALKAQIAVYAEAAEEYVNQECGMILEGDWSTHRNFYLEQSDTIDLINRAQIAQGTVHLKEKFAGKEAEILAKTGMADLDVDISASSVIVSNNYIVKAGPMSMKDIYKLYRYDNTLYLLPLTGAQIKGIMEFTASERLRCNTASGTPVFSVTGDSFTNPVFYGVDFQYDMSKPVGERVVNLKFADGREFNAEETYLLAVNNYHLGNGPFAEYSTADAIWSQTDDLGGGAVQDLIAEFVAAETAENGGVSPAPSNWSLIYSGEIVAGEVTGEYIADYVEDPASLADGDRIYIYHVGDNQLLSNVPSGEKLSPSTDVVTGEGKLGTNNADAVFTVKKNAAGQFTFVDTNGKFITAGATGNSLTLKEEESDFSLWLLEKQTGGVYIRSLNAAFNGNAQYIEYYGGAFTTYGLQGGGSPYLYQLFRLNDGGSDPIEPTEPSVEPTEPIEHTHAYTPAVTAPTCTEKGYTTYTCACGESYRSNFTDALGHDYAEEITKDPTATEDGEKTFTCANCGEKYTEIIPATGKPDSDPLDDFTDLPEGAWYEEGVRYALTNGLMNGMGDGKFEPEGTLTRAMLVTILYRVENTPDVGGVKNPFMDVADGQWYTDAIVWAADRGIVKGMSATEFMPELEITREQMATILYRYDGAEAVEEDLSVFADASDVQSYALEAMQWAVSEGILNGTDGNRLAPQETATRAQTATILMRYLEK